MSAMLDFWENVVKPLLAAGGPAEGAPPPGPAPADNVAEAITRSNVRHEASSGNVSRPRDQLVMEQQKLKQKLSKAQDYPGREADEARLQEVTNELDRMPPDSAHQPTGPGKAPPPQGGGRGGDTVDTNAGSQAPRGPNERQPGDTRRVVAQPPPPDNAIVTVRTAKGPEKMTAQEYRARVHKAEGWVSEQRMEYYAKGGVKGTSPPGLYEQAADQFGLDRGWQNPLNPIRYGRDVIVDGPKPPGSPPQAPSKGGDSGGEGGPGEGGKGPGGAPVADPNQNAPAAEPQTGGAKLQGAEDFAKTMTELDKKHTAIQEQLDKNPSTEEAAKLQEQSKAVEKELDTKLAQADQFAKEIAADPKLNIKGSTAQKIFEEVRARFAPGEAGVGGLAVTVASAFFLGLAIKNIYDADTMMDKVEGTINLGKNLVVGSVEYGLAQTVLGGPMAFAVLAFTSALSDGNMDEQERQQHQAAYQAALEAREKHSIVQFMSEKFPGSAETVENVDRINDQKLYDELKKRVDQMKEQQHNQQVRDTGFHDGLLGGTYNKDKVVPEGKNAAQFDPELVKKWNTLYESGYGDGLVAKPTRLQRALALGAEDRKAGKPVHGEEVKNWYAAEVAKWKDLVPVSLEVYTAYLRAFTGSG